MTITLTINLVPKRMLTKKEAATHCGRPLNRFEAECPIAPIKFANGDVRYDVVDLDAWLDNLKNRGNDADDIIGRLG